MNSEQLEVRKFFEKLLESNKMRHMSWIGAGFCVCFLVLFCFMPIQMLLEEPEEAVTVVLMIIICGPLAGFFRLQPYTYLANTNTGNERARKVSELLKYHPINQKEVKKMQLMYLVRFMAKVAGVCMLVQIPITLREYGQLSILNFLYIFVAAFVYPVLNNAVPIWLEK